MKIIIAPDSFKESLSAKIVANNIAMAILKIIPDANLVQIPISDGGEGLLEALISPLGGRLISVRVKDPLLRDIQAKYGILKNKTTAIIEMATASGLELLQENEKNPLLTSTFGTGQLIKDALDKGCTKIILGLGGSATNDGGVGMLTALGGKFTNGNGEAIGAGGGALNDLQLMNISELDKRLLSCEIVGACDVANPLTGEDGASLVFGGQKGGNKGDLIRLDQNLLKYASLIKKTLNIEINTVKGAGAAGGMGAALLAFFDAELVSGIDLVLQTLQLEKHIKNSDYVITGEGKIDKQTLSGKTITGLAKIAKKHGVPVIAITGKIGKNVDVIYQLGVTSIFSIINEPMELKESMREVETLIQSCILNIFRTIKTFKK
jgi:glycerate kinase